MARSGSSSRQETDHPHGARDDREPGEESSILAQAWYHPKILRKTVLSQSSLQMAVQMAFGTFLLLLFSLVDRLKFGYACEMAPFVSAGLLVKSKKPSLGSRTYGGAQLVGAGIFGTIIGALVLSVSAAITTNVIARPLVIVALMTFATVPVTYQQTALALGPSVQLLLGYGYIIVRGVSFEKQRAIWQLSTELFRLELLSGGITFFTGWFAWPILAGDTMRQDLATLIKDLGDIVSSNATYLLHSTTDHDRAEQDSGEPEVGNMAHKRMANARVKMGFASGGNTHGRSPLAVTLRDFRPRLEAMQALCSEASMEPPYVRLGKAQYRVTKWSSILECVRDLAKSLSSLNVLMKGEEMDELVSGIASTPGVNIISACKLVMAQISISLMALSDGILADVQGKQARPALMKPVWHQLEHASAKAMFKFATMSADEAAFKPENWHNKRDPLWKARPLCFLYCSLNAMCESIVKLEDMLAIALSIPRQEYKPRKNRTPCASAIAKLSTFTPGPPDSGSKFGQTPITDTAQQGINEDLQERIVHAAPRSSFSLDIHDTDGDAEKAQLLGKSETLLPTANQSQDNSEISHTPSNKSSVSHKSNTINDTCYSTQTDSWNQKEEITQRLDVTVDIDELLDEAIRELNKQEVPGVTSLLDTHRDENDLELGILEVESASQNLLLSTNNLEEEWHTHPQTQHSEAPLSRGNNFADSAYQDKRKLSDLPVEYEKSEKSNTGNVASPKNKLQQDIYHLNAKRSSSKDEKLDHFQPENRKKISDQDARPLQRWPNEAFGNNQLVQQSKEDDYFERTSPRKTASWKEWVRYQIVWAQEPLMTALCITAVDAFVYAQLKGLKEKVTHPRKTWQSFRRDRYQQFLVKAYVTMLLVLSLIVLLNVYFPPSLGWNSVTLFLTAALTLNPKVDTTVWKGLLRVALQMCGAWISFGVLYSDKIFYNPYYITLIYCGITFIFTPMSLALSPELGHLFLLGLFLQGICTIDGKNVRNAYLPLYSRATLAGGAALICLAISSISPWYVVDDAMEKIGKSFSNAGQVFSHMTVAWCEELECGHRRGEEIPHWLEEKKIGVSTLPRYVIREKVAIHLVQVFQGLQAERITWQEGSLNLPRVVSKAFDLMHEVLESLSAVELATRQKPLISATFTVGPWQYWQAPVKESMLNVAEGVTRVCDDTAAVMRESGNKYDMERLRGSIGYLKKLRGFYAEELVSAIKLYFRDVHTDTYSSWSAEDIVRFESHQFAYRRTLDIVLHVATEIAESQWINEHVTQKPFSRYVKVWTQGGKKS